MAHIVRLVSEKPALAVEVDDLRGAEVRWRRNRCAVAAVDYAAERVPKVKYVIEHGVRNLGICDELHSPAKSLRGFRQSTLLEVVVVP